MEAVVDAEVESDNEGHDEDDGISDIQNGNSADNIDIKEELMLTLEQEDDEDFIEVV